MGTKKEDFEKLLSFVTKTIPQESSLYLSIKRNFKTLYLLAATPTQKKEFDTLLIKTLDSSNKFSTKYLEEFFFDHYLEYDSLCLSDLVSELSKKQKSKRDFYIALDDVTVSDAYNLGCFQIVPQACLENQLRILHQNLNSTKQEKSRITEEDLINIMLPANKKAYSVLKTTIEAYDDYAFQELAHTKFLDFDKLLSFACYPFAKRQIAATITPNHNQEEMVSIGEESCYKNAELSNKAILDRTPIESLMREMSNVGTDFIWTLYSNIRRNEIEDRIVAAALWVGMANNEEEGNIAFVEYCFALETLLQFNSGQLLSPSIGYSISEAAAFIISNQYKERKEIKEKINKLYSLRSAIVHGGTKKIFANDLNEIFTIIMQLMNGLYHKKWIDLKTMKNLYAKIEDIKLGKML